VIPSVVTTRGLDLSGTLDGAGGIGGLLARSRHATSSPYAVNGNSFYHADGNGNVTYLASSGGGTDAAYRYDPFGRWLAQMGPYASANGLRFSSKPWVAHNGSNTDGLYYYGYRFYDPLTQRWLKRDPIGENGGFNLYGFVGNSPNFYIDALGLFVTVPRPIIIEISPGLNPGTTMPRLYPPIPIIPPQNSDPSASPGNQPTPDDGLPPLNKPWNAPKVCPRTCPPERLKELSD
jgi:RHS repeat-associated protein